PIAHFERSRRIYLVSGKRVWAFFFASIEGVMASQQPSLLLLKVSITLATTI
ncbi:hypothetical protein ACJX0J_023856, partial [Zea mays]